MQTAVRMLVGGAESVYQGSNECEGYSRLTTTERAQTDLVTQECHGLHTVYDSLPQETGI